MATLQPVNTNDAYTHSRASRRVHGFGVGATNAGRLNLHSSNNRDHAHAQRRSRGIGK